MEKMFKKFVDYKILIIGEDNINQVYNLCKQNRKYYEYLQEEPTFDGVKSIMKELPPNTTLDEKFFVGFYRGDELVAILDLIDGYPEEKKRIHWSFYG